MRATSRVARAITRPVGMLVRLMPCTIVTATPLTVNLGDGVAVPGVKIAGATYTNGAAANALMVEPGLPIVLPIGA
jgi:hypothetical protein